MARASGPYSSAFPVNFTSGGDTTRDAFKKHIDEIARIYGILTDFDKDIANVEGGSGALQEHINSTNPHPNWTPSVSWANVTNKPGLGDLSGDLNGNRIIGSLARATIPYLNVTDLDAHIASKIPPTPEVPDKGDGITSKDLSADGYVKFNNGLIIQWGTVEITKPSNSSIVRATAEKIFPIKFPTKCFSVNITPIGATAAYVSSGTTSTTVLQEKFTVIVPTTDSVGASTGLTVSGTIRVYFWAIGV